MMPAFCRTLVLAGSLVGALGYALLGALGCASAAGGRGRRESFEQLEATSVPAAQAKILVLLTTGPGSMIVLGSETDSLSVRYAVSTDTRAGLFRNQVETVDKGDSLLVTIRPASGSMIDLQVEGPEKLAVYMLDEERAVVLRNIENRVEVIRDAGGSLDVDDIEGPLSVQDGSGPVRIHDVRGPILIKDEGGGITVEKITKSIRIESRSGDVTIEDAGGDVYVRAGPGSLLIRKVAGKVTYRKTGAGQVTIEDITGMVERL